MHQRQLRHQAAGLTRRDGCPGQSRPPTPWPLETYANVLVVKDGNQDSEKIQALAKALKSDAVRDFINKTYEGAVVPVF